MSRRRNRIRLSYSHGLHAADVVGNLDDNTPQHRPSKHAKARKPKRPKARKSGGS